MRFLLAAFFTASVVASELAVVVELPPLTKREIVVFSTARCVPCVFLKRNLDALGIKYSEAVPPFETVTEYPTVIVYVGNRETFRFTGNRSKEELAALLKPKE